MKHNKYIALSVLLALSVGMPATAQETAAADSALINVAFRKVAQEDVMGGVSTLNYRELIDRNYNTYSFDNMQGYVPGYNGASIWGLSGVLVLIDGVPRSESNIKPDEIEQVTFLKGAQAVVLYGSRAAQGVVMITTKRGTVSDGLNLNVRANTGWNVAKSYPEYLGSAEYMTLYNEARVNDGLLPLYSQTDIYNYASGKNPYRYPDVDFYSSDYIKKAYNRSDITVEIEGGNERARFYSNVSYYRTGDHLNFGEAKNNVVDRFNARGNVDFRINHFIDAYVNANATYYNAKTPNGENYWQQAATLRPNRISPLIPVSYIDENCLQAQPLLATSNNIIDGKYFLGGTQTHLTNVFADYYAAGKNTWTSRQFQFDAGLNVDLGSVLKGLSFHTMVAVDYATTYSSSFSSSYATFEPTWSNYNGKDVIVALNNHETVDTKTGEQEISNSTDYQTIAFNAHFDYNRTFAGVHNVSAMLVANGFQISESEAYHKTSNANLGLQLGYNYARKYYADFAIATPWSARLPEGHRAAVSPSLTLGWRLTGEHFMEGSIFDDLTLSASVSDLKTDIGINDYYMYLGTYQSGGWWDWNGGSGHSAIQSRRGTNNDLTFIRRKEFSASIHAALLQRSLTVDASFFTSKMQGGIIMASNQMPSYFRVYYPESSFTPNINYNDDTRTGFDMGVNYKKKLGDFGLQAGVNMTYYTTNASKRDDSNVADSYQYQQGKPLDAIWGYECLGFFKDQDDIANSPEQILGTTPRPGDLKYKDQNGDNVIDSKDQVNLGKGGWYGSPMTLGMNFTMKYKDFTLFMLGTGYFGGHAMKNSSYWWISGEGKYSAVVRNRWTTETAATASYPRLTTGSGANNYQNSDFWIYSTSCFELAKVQLTYDVPKTILGDSFVKGLSVYVSGNSLLTISGEREQLEMNVGGAPKSRFYNLGVKVSF